MLSWNKRLNPSWPGAVAGAFILVLALIAFERKTSLLGGTVGQDWSLRDRLPCPDLTGTYSALPLAVAMDVRLSHSPPGSVVLLGDSTFTSSAGCGDGELPGDQDLRYRLKTALGGTDVVNFGLFSADWQILSLQASMLQHNLDPGSSPRNWVVMSNFPIAGGSPYPVLFSQLCHSSSCGSTCRALCMEEGPERGQGLWSLFRYAPVLADPLVGIASYLQTFVTAAATTARTVSRADRLGWRTLASEKAVTALYEQDLLTRGPLAREPGWKEKQLDLIRISLAVYRKFGWKENGPLQLWYKYWMVKLRDLPGQVILVSQTIDPEIFNELSAEDQGYLEKMRRWQDETARQIIPRIRIARLEMEGKDYADLIHWSSSGTTKAAARIAQEIPK